MLVKNYTGAKTTEYNLPPRKLEKDYLEAIITSLFHGEVKVNITRYDVRLRSNLTADITIKFTEDSFVYIKIRGHSISFRAFRWHWKDRSENTSNLQKWKTNQHYLELIKLLWKEIVLLGVLYMKYEKLFCSFLPETNPPRYKLHKTLRIKHFKRINKSVFFSYHIQSWGWWLQNSSNC